MGAEQHILMVVVLLTVFAQCQGWPAECSSSCQCPRRCCRDPQGNLVTQDNGYGPGSCVWGAGIPAGGSCDPSCPSCKCITNYICGASNTCVLHPWL